MKFVPLRRAKSGPGAAPGSLQAEVDDRMNDEILRASRAKKGSPFLSTKQAAFYLGVSPRKLQALRVAGSGPVFRRHCRFVRYHIDDLDAWSRTSGTHFQAM